MDPLTAVLLVAAGVVVLGAVAWWLSAWAARLDRLHARVEGSRAALDAQLLRRAAVAQHLATSGALDPASALLLLTAATQAQEAAEEDGDRGWRPVGSRRAAAESDLSRALRATLTQDTVAALAADPAAAPLLQALGAAGHRVVLARRFANDAVEAALRVRRARVVRWAHLAGHAAAPRPVELDDAEPLAGALR